MLASLADAALTGPTSTPTSTAAHSAALPVAAVLVKRIDPPPMSRFVLLEHACLCVSGASSYPDREAAKRQRVVIATPSVGVEAARRKALEPSRSGSC